MVNLLKNNWVTILILALIFVIRIPHMTHNPYEYDSWRQSDTEAIARNFVEHRFNIFFPQLNYDGPLPNYVQLEFQITTFIIAILYKMFGYHYVLARIVPILFFMGSAYYMYLISKHYYNQATAWIS
jgi:4-amino-4-deoxy-L-arabinose transferase-like glycosyltransferase